MKKHSLIFAKKLIMCACLLAYFFVCFSATNIAKTNYKRSLISFASQTSKITYAKILEDCFLYKNNNMSTDINNIYFCLPKTYFVTILSKINDDIVKVKYSTFVGFCYSSCVSIVSFTPNVAELVGITFDINQLAGTQVWSAPSDTKGIKSTTIPAGTTQIEYIASTTGDIPLGGTVNVWYYARFTPSSNTTSVYEGYVYSEATVNLSNIPNNLEVETTIDTPKLDGAITIDGALKVVLIVLICLPFAILFVVSLLKAIKQLKNKKHSTNINEHTTTPVTTPNNKAYFIKKEKPKASNLYDNNNEPLETIEVSFPQYDYIDDDDLL